MYGVICMSKYIHGRTCVYNINYHIVWCVKYRRKVLTPQISDKLYELNNLGFEVLRFKNEEVLCAPESVILQIKQTLNKSGYINVRNCAIVIDSKNFMNDKYDYQNQMWYTYYLTFSCAALLRNFFNSWACLISLIKRLFTDFNPYSFILTFLAVKSSDFKSFFCS